MAMYIGLIRAGWIGLVVGGLAFLLPGAALSGLLAWVYLRYGALPEISRVFSMGIEPVVLVVVLATVWRLGRTALRTWDLWFWAGAALILSLLGVSPVWIFLGTALVAPSLTSCLPWPGGPPSLSWSQPSCRPRCVGRPDA
jgi:chromate transporter